MLLLTTALYAACATLPAMADPAPGARPQGGSVSAGSASIASGANTTTVTQTSARAVIDWQGFDVGSQQTVKFVQPGASATVLNRVSSGEPSQIAGRISANGQVIIENRSGIIFTDGAQVDAHALVATAAGIGTAPFMAGSTKFDMPAQAGAAVVNRGRITVAETGLAALVAPNVGNSGVIEAKAGRVVLAGAATHTVDLYGDGLLSIDVGASGTVTNVGVIRADGGKVLLSAAAADGIVTGLVEAGGRIAVDNARGRGGSIEIRGTGGSVIVSGTLSATGRTRGGVVAAVGSDATTIASGARIDASGGSGGRVAVGRASGVTGARTEIAVGAVIAADGGRKGKGGSVTVMSAQSTTMAGRISATGGRAGGTVEVSGLAALHLTGVVDVSSAGGLAGTLLIDPQDLVILAGGSDGGLLQVGGGNGTIAVGDNAGSAATIDPAVFQGLTGNVVLQAARDLSVLSPVSSAAGTLSLEAGRNLTVAAPINLTGGGTLAFAAAVPGFAGAPGYDAGGPLGVLRIALSGSAVALNGNVVLSSGLGGAQIVGAVLAERISATVAAGGSLAVNGAIITGDAQLSAGQILLTGLVRASGTLDLVSGGTISATGTVAAGLLTGRATDARFSGSGNAIGSLAAFTTSDGFTLQSSSDLKVVGPVVAGGTPAPSLGNNAEIDLIVNGGIAIGQPGTAGLLNAGTVKLLASGAISEPQGFLFANVLLGPAQGELIPQAVSVNLTGLNNITAIGGFATQGDLRINSLGDVTIVGTLFAGGALGTLPTNGATVELTAGGNLALGQPGTQVLVNGGIVSLLAPGTISEPNGLILTNLLTGPAAGQVIAQAASVQLGGANSIRAIGDLATTGDIGINDTASVTVTGSVTAGTIAAPDARNTAQLTVQTAGDVTIDGGARLALLNAGTVALLAAGTISEPGGAIGSNVLRGWASAGLPVISAGVTLEGLNAITRLEDFSTTGGFILRDGVGLTVAGTVSAGGLAAPVAGNNATLLLLALGDIAIGAQGTVGLLNAGTVSLASSGGSISEVSGGIIANRFADLSSVGALSLTLNGTNAFGELGAFSARGNIAIADTLPLTVVGRVSAGGLPAPNAANTASLTLASDGAITLGRTGGAASLNAGTVTVLATGSLSAPNGTIAANLLNGPTGAQTTGVNLPGANAVSALGTFVAGGDMTLASTTDLAVVGAINAGGGAGGAATLVLQSAGNLLIGRPGTVAVLSAGTVALLAAGTISEPNGFITADTVTGSAPGRSVTSATAVALDAPGNAIGHLGAFASAGDLSLTDSGALTVTGAVSAAGTLGLTIGGSIILGAAEMQGQLAAGSVLLLTAGAISEPNGSIKANLFSGPHPGAAIVAASSITLTGPNAILALGSIASSGDMALLDVVGATIVGGLSAGTASAPDPANTAQIALILGAGLSIGSASLPGSISAGKVALAAAGTIDAPNGTVSANTLSTVIGSSVGGLQLPGANRIARVGSLTLVGGDLDLHDTVPVVVYGALDTQGLAGAQGSSRPQGNANIAADAGITLAAGSVVSARNVAITAAGGDLTQAGGAALIAADTSMALTASGNITLAGPVTQVGTFGSSSAMSVPVAGTITVASSGGSIGQSATGTIRGARSTSLAVSALGSAIFDGPGNNVSVISNVAAGGHFTFGNTSQLAMPGSIAAGGDIAITNGADITQSGGFIVSATGGVRIKADGAAFNQSANAMILATQGNVGISGDTHVTIGGSISAGGALDLASQRGLVSEVNQIVGGVITSGNVSTSILTATSGLGIGLAPLIGSNTIAATGGLVTSRGAIALSSLTSMTIGGDVTGPTSISLSSRGDLSIAAGVQVRASGTADAVALTAGGNLAVSPGAIVSGARSILQAPGVIGISGVVDGLYVSIGGSGGAMAQQVVFASGAMLETGGAGIGFDKAMPNAAWPTATTAAQGAFISAHRVDFGGMTVLTRNDAARSPSTGTNEATLRVDIGSGGSLESAGGLSAATSILFVNLGATARASGIIQVDNLYLAYVRASPGSAEFTGTIGAVGGQAAAQIGSISPAQNAFYRINACPLASVSCFVVSTELPPQSNPIQDLDIRPARDSVDEADVLLPNVSGRDF